MKKSDYRVVSVTIVCHKDDVDMYEQELITHSGNIGLFTISGEKRNLTAQEHKEFERQCYGR